ncbi:DUF1552 domain-containing protein [Anatilimnocola floriformis]|uniref:DUF1552 domain-containing protein n=1 Tax=Anatilimnocola floriformis TaxID=2948575 RepID=UPI0020C229BB|nr:DUF1552 domain-containing protein [Anatilimnocola floriformis]
MNSKPQISRRSLLRASGALLALPFFETLFPTRIAQGAAVAKPPQRLGIFTVTGGTVVESWKPAAAGTIEKLPSILRPLEFAKDQINIVSGLCHAGRSENLNAHEHCSLTHLTGASSVKKEGGKLYAGISVDQAAAAVIGKDTLLPSLEIGLNGGEKNYSFRSRESVVPYEGNPRLIFDRMFRGRTPVAPNWQRRAEASATKAPEKPSSDSLDRSVLDLVLSQANDLRRVLGKGDQQKLDQYLESVHSVEKRIAATEERQRQDLLDLASPSKSKLVLPESLPKHGTPIWEITRPTEQDPSRHADYIRLIADMLVLGFQTDTTRVATVAAGSDESMFPGVVTVGYERHCHTLEHQGNAGRPEDADPIAREALRQIHAWYTMLFAETVQKLANIDEGGSTLLDNCALLYTSYMADGGHGRDDYPVVIAGRAGGKLATGRHLAFEKKAPMANLYVELLNLLGVPTTTFGDSHTSRFAGSLDGRLPGFV